jgi:DNA-binding NtrC family response regulator
MILETLHQKVRHPDALVVFPHNENLDGLLDAITETGNVPVLCRSFEEAQEVMKHKHIQVIICEDHLPPAALDAILKLAKHRRKPIPVIIASRTGEWQEFLRVLRQGAFDYLVLPARPEEVKRVLELAMAESREVNRYESESTGPRPFSAGEFVLGLGDRFEYAAPTDACTFEPPARVCSQD